MKNRIYPLFCRKAGIKSSILYTKLFRPKRQIHGLGMLIFCLCAAIVFLGASKLANGHPISKGKAPKVAPVPRYEPARAPVVTGEFIVGVVNVTFRETEFPKDIDAAMSQLERVTDTNLESDPTSGSKSLEYSHAVNQEEYFKIYSNDITWPKIVIMPDANSYYEDPNFYGYYCEYNASTNPMGWKEKEEGSKRVEKMNKEALRFAAKSYRGDKPRFICYNYITKRPEDLADDVTDDLLEFYPGVEKSKKGSGKSRMRENLQNSLFAEEFDPWLYYRPVCKWAEPMWPNSKIQINDFAGGVFAHELGHSLGAPDVYRVGRFSDGIGGNASLLAYGPTANAFSRFYHHAFIKEENHPTIQSSGTYTLHPRHIKPAGSEALGYLIPSNHPHYMYHVEYIHQENSSVGVGPKYEGMLISVINLGLTNYLGSPDYTYVYRPNDPFFRGLGDTSKCLFGKAHGRTEFNMNTEPSSRLPNLLEGGVSFENIEEHDGTLTFDLTIDRKPISGSDYTNSMLPQIRLDEISAVQATSITMDCTIKFRGEPLKTIYGFCWSTSRNPTVKDSTYILAHRECYRGHAINLKPNTTYHVRAFATNGLGVRYSDEEKTIKTLDSIEVSSEIGPLFTDGFSENQYLYSRYSRSASSQFIDYSSVCAMAKLIAYYRPEKISSISIEDPKKSTVDFNQINWSPLSDHPLERLEQVDGFFYYLFREILEVKLHEEKPSKNLISNIVKLTNVRSKPVLNLLEADNSEEISKLIRDDLALSRPVLMVFSYDSVMASEPIRWVLIDGMNREGEFHFDFPLNTKMFIDNDWEKMQTGYYSINKMILPEYKVSVVTSFFYK